MFFFFVLHVNSVEGSFLYSLSPTLGAPYSFTFSASPVLTASRLLPNLTSPVRPVLPAASPEAGGLWEVGWGGGRPRPLESDSEVSPHPLQQPPPIWEGVPPDILGWGVSGLAGVPTPHFPGLAPAP